MKIAEHERKAKRTMAKFAASLRVKEEIVDLPEAEKFNAQGEPLKCIGKVEVRSEIIREPENVYLRKYYILSYADPRAEAETGEADIKQALQSSDYRQAVRLRYLQTLKYLEDEGKIDWQPSKTPSQYVRQVNMPAFTTLSRHFINVR